MVLCVSIPDGIAYVTFCNVCLHSLLFISKFWLLQPPLPRAPFGAGAVSGGVLGTVQHLCK